MTDEFDGVDATEKAGIEAALNKCRALAAQIATELRNKRRRSENPRKCHSREDRVRLIGPDQRITSGPAARRAAFRGRIHGCTRTIAEASDSPLAPRAPSIHGTQRHLETLHKFGRDWRRSGGRASPPGAPWESVRLQIDP
jgi:hypothetical protein